MGDATLPTCLEFVVGSVVREGTLVHFGLAMGQQKAGSGNIKVLLKLKFDFFMALGIWELDAVELRR